MLRTSNLAVLLIFPALFISGTHKGRSRDQVLQRAYYTLIHYKLIKINWSCFSSRKSEKLNETPLPPQKKEL